MFVVLRGCGHRKAGNTNKKKDVRLYVGGTKNIAGVSRRAVETGGVGRLRNKMKKKNETHRSVRY